MRIIGALFGSIRHRRITTPDERLAWLLVVATIPVGIAGLALDNVMREYLGKPVPAAVFLVLNGIVLFTVERLQRTREAATAPAGSGPGAASRQDIGEQPTAVLPAMTSSGVTRDPANQPTTRMRAVSAEEASDARLARLGWWEAIAVGACQILALLPGVSRSGATIAGGLLRGLRHDDAARFAFLLATPVIAAAGMLKVPELARPEMHGAIGPTLVGSLVAGVGAYFSVRFLVCYFQTSVTTVATTLTVTTATVAHVRAVHRPSSPGRRSHSRSRTGSGFGVLSPRKRTRSTPTLSPVTALAESPQGYSSKLPSWGVQHSSG